MDPLDNIQKATSENRLPGPNSILKKKKKQEQSRVEESLNSDIRIPGTSTNLFLREKSKAHILTCGSNKLQKEPPKGACHFRQGG